MSNAYRQGASDYISEKLGNMGLILGLQSFLPSKFKQQVSQIQILSLNRLLQNEMQGAVLDE